MHSCHERLELFGHAWTDKVCTGFTWDLHLWTKLQLRIHNNNYAIIWIIIKAWQWAILMTWCTIVNLLVVCSLQLWGWSCPTSSSCHAWVSTLRDRSPELCHAYDPESLPRDCSMSNPNGSRHHLHTAEVYSSFLWCFHQEILMWGMLVFPVCQSHACILPL